MTFRPSVPEFDLDTLPETALLLEPRYLDGAIVGLHDGRVVYDYDLLVGLFVANNDDKDPLTYQEHIDFNIVRSLPYYGDKSPIIVSRNPYLVGEVSSLEQDEDYSFISIDDQKCLVVG